MLYTLEPHDIQTLPIKSIIAHIFREYPACITNYHAYIGVLERSGLQDELSAMKSLFMTLNETIANEPISDPEEEQFLVQEIQKPCEEYIKNLAFTVQKEGNQDMEKQLQEIETKEVSEIDTTIIF